MLVRAMLAPFVPLGGSVLVSTGAASPSVPLRASRSATAPEQGLWCETLACVAPVSPPRGMVWCEHVPRFFTHTHRRLIRGLASPST